MIRRLVRYETVHDTNQVQYQLSGVVLQSDQYGRNLINLADDDEMVLDEPSEIGLGHVVSIIDHRALTLPITLR